MHPTTHLLAGWLVANSGQTSRRERAMITIASVLPDLDGFGIGVELLTRNSESPVLWWSDFHHKLGHNFVCGLAWTLLAFAIAQRRWKTTALTFLSFHLHLLCDIVGARGPDGDPWPIYYLWPFNPDWHYSWEAQWALNAWPNMVITAAALFATLYLAWRRGFSLLEFIPGRADQVLVETLRNRFPRKN